MVRAHGLRAQPNSCDNRKFQWFGLCLGLILLQAACALSPADFNPLDETIPQVSSNESVTAQNTVHMNDTCQGNKTCVPRFGKVSETVACKPVFHIRSVEVCRNGYRKKTFTVKQSKRCKCTDEAIVVVREPCNCPTNITVNILCGPTVKENSQSAIQHLSDRCKFLLVEASNTVCSMLNNSFNWIENPGAEGTSKSGQHLLRRTARSVPLDENRPQCGKHQHFVLERNPCPLTCENNFFGKPNPHCLQHTGPRGPGCECKPGFVLDGILCVPPSQCGCLDSVCVDRAPADQCKQWQLQGRCEKDRLAMDRVCRATCHKCAHRCQNQIATGQCELFRDRGACKDELYQMLCPLTCTPEKCSCPPCRIETGICNPHTKNAELRRICFRLRRDGKCEPLVTRRFKPCGECPATMHRIPGKCDFCKAQRIVRLQTFFREEGGLFRCRTIETIHSEPCVCKPMKLLRTVCYRDTTVVRKIFQQEQKSCFDCLVRKQVLVDKPIVCKRRWIKRGPCHRSDNQSPSMRKVLHLRQVAKNCKCRLAVRVTMEVCECPSPKRSMPICQPHLNQFAVKETIYRPQGRHCSTQVKLHLIPRPPCPHQSAISPGQFVCNPETCDRTWHMTSWHWEDCKCVPMRVIQPAGKCCCPKTETIQSPCQNGSQTERVVIYDLVEGACQRHVTERTKSCACPDSRHLYKCDPQTNDKWIKKIDYHLKSDGTCKEVTHITKFPTKCGATGIRRITGCTIKRPGDTRRYRHLIITGPRIERCMCHEPNSTVEFEACDCPESNDPEVKQIHQCPQWCHHVSDNRCDARCQNVFVWQKFVYVGQGVGQCRAEVVRKIVKPCCCRRDRRILERSCSPSGKEQIVRVAETRLIRDRCVRIVHSIREKVQCAVGFQRHDWGPYDNQGARMLREWFGYVDRCQCKQRAVGKTCQQDCPKPVQTTECDVGSRELVHTLINFIPIGCRCEKVAYKRRTSVLCPETEKLISSHCSEITNLETRKYLKSYQHDCQCKQRVVVQQRPCGCPKPQLSEMRCDPKTNIRRGIRTVHELEVDRCEVRKEVVQLPTDCSQYMLLERRQNDGHPKVHLTCDPKTGRGQLWINIWVPEHCKCVRRKRVLREGVCRCPPPQTAMHCDGETNNWVRKVTSFVLDKHHLQCRRREDIHAKPTYCPRARLRSKPCNLKAGYRELELYFHKRDHCHCIPQRRVIRQRCGCPPQAAHSIQRRQKCDRVRGIWHLELIGKRWNDQANQCSPFRMIKSVPVVCKPKIRVIHEPCIHGKMIEHLTERHRDPNGCFCRETRRKELRDCRCPTQVLRDGHCDDKREAWDEIVLERRWDAHKQACVIERRTQSTHFCKCPEPKVTRQCKQGVIEETKIAFRLNPTTASCERLIVQSRTKPQCQHPPELARQLPHSSLFHRYRQSTCDPASCTLKLEVFTSKYNPAKCMCQWDLAESRRCTCCGCPKPNLKVECKNNNQLVGTVTYFATEKERCGHKCVPKTRRIFREMDCSNYPKPPEAYWTSCDRVTCLQHYRAPYYDLKHCKCVLAEKTLASRTCCCPKKVHHEKRCLTGELSIITHKYDWKDGRCLRSVHKQIKPIACPSHVETRLGECRLETCRQPIYELGWRADPVTCACRQYQTLRGEKECCCREKPSTRAVCVGNCVVSVKEVFKFDQKNHRCIKENYIRRRCPQCPKPHIIRGPCDVDASCMQTVRHVKYFVEDCKCKRLERVQQNRCCCPKPASLGSQCLDEIGVVETKEIYHDLVNGHCAKRVKINRIPVTCPPAGQESSIEVPPCNPHTCLRPVLRDQWVRIGCQCVKQKPRQFETCCCSNRIVRTKKICRPDGTFTLFAQAWKLRNGECVKVNLNKGLHTPPCVAQKITPLGPCDSVTKRQPALLERSVVKQCNCQLVYRQQIDRVCACPPPEEAAEACDSNTCLQRVTRVIWAVEQRDGKCHRLAPQTSTRPCCCPREQSEPTESTRCMPETGQLEIVRTAYRFDPVRRTCEPHQDRRYKVLECPSHGKLLKGKCNSGQQWTMDRLLIWRPDLPHCRCREFMKLFKRPCDCSHLDRELRKPICLADEGVLLKKRVVHRERFGTCQPEERWMKRVVVCPDGVRRHVQCDPKTCEGVHISRWFERVACRCVPRVSKARGKCCCPKPHEQHRCVNDGHLAVVDRISYRLDSVKMECVRQVDRINRDVECVERKAHVLRRYCDRETCHPVTLLRKIERRNCQCGHWIRRLVHRERQCCCPPPRFANKCYEMYGVLSRVVYRYELFKGHCITRKLVDQDKVVCPPERVERDQPCDDRTGLRTVIRHIYTRVGCKCVLQVKQETEPCACPAPRIVKEQCMPDTAFRQVFRVWFELDGDGVQERAKCRKMVAHLYNEPCQCPGPQLAKRCHRGEMLLLKRVHYLSMHTGHPSCNVKTYVKRIPVVCDPHVIRTYRSACRNQLRKVIRVRQVLDARNCQCRKMVKIQIEACDCHLKNTEKRDCQNGILMLFRTVYSSRPGLKRCVKTTARSVHPVVCSGQPEVIESSGCNIEQPHGIYRSEEVRWQQVVDCRCVTKRKQVLRLCACPKPRVEKRCLDTVNLAVYKTSYSHIANQCIPSQDVVTSEIRCLQPARIVDRSTCERTPSTDPGHPGCLERIQVAFDEVQDCHCKPRVITIRRRCCTPAPQTRRQCDPIQSRWISTTVKFKLAPGKVLFESGDLVIRDHVLQAVQLRRQQAVVCPETQVRENCNPLTGLWTQVIDRFEQRECHCKRVRQIKRGRCQCPPTRTRVSQCEQNFQHRTTESFELIDGKCVPRSRTERTRCACPKPIRRVYCDGQGRWVKCFAQFLFNPAAKVCRLVKHCVRWQQDCPKPRNRVVGQCGPQTGFRQVVQYVRFEQDPTTCRCQPVVLKEWKEFCQCDHLNRKSESCHNGAVKTNAIVHELVNGDCVPKRLTHTKPVTCPAPRFRTVPCNRSPNSAARGWSLKLVNLFEVQHCKCVPKFRVLKKPCDCNLIHGEKRYRRCLGQGRMIIKHLFWTLQAARCTPGMALYTVKVPCKPEETTRVGPCQIGPDGVGWKRVDRLQRRVVGCKCVWIPVKSGRQICKCPEPQKSMTCVDDGQLLLIKQTKFQMTPTECRPITAVRKVEPCASSRLRLPRFKVGPCNRDTCLAERFDYRLKSVQCKCRLQRRRSYEPCCCRNRHHPGAVQHAPHCDPVRNVLTVRETHYALERADRGSLKAVAYCQPQLREKTVAVRCGLKHHRIRIKPCDGQFHQVIVVRPVVENCVCKDIAVKRLRIRCGCPRRVRHVPGRCVDGEWAEDKWIALRAVPVHRVAQLKVTAVKCQPVILETKRKRCGCPAPVESTICDRGRTLVRQRIAYRLNKELDNCEKQVMHSPRTVRCPPPRMYRTRCAADTNYVQHDVVRFWTRENCQCRAHAKKRTWICDCAARYPPQRREHCLPDGRSKSVELTRWVNVQRQCKRVVQTHVEPVACPNRVRMIRGVCDRDLPNRRKVFWLQQHPRDCHCVWHRLKESAARARGLRTSEACRCRAHHQVRQCHPSAVGQPMAQVKIIHIRYTIQNGECEPSQHVEIRPVSCDPPVQVINGPCDPMSNTRLVKRIVKTLVDCHCRETVSEHRCHCGSCPPIKYHVQCHRPVGLLRIIKVIHKPDQHHCLCEARRLMRHSVVRCPQGKRLLSKGVCQARMPNQRPGDDGMQERSVLEGDKYRQVIWTVSERDGCRCRSRRLVTEEVCACNEDPRVEQQCVDDRMVVMVKSKRQRSLDGTKCERIIVSKTSHPVYLGKPEKIVRCNSRTGVEYVTELLPYIADCKRRVRVRVYRKRCKCQSQPRLIKRTPCGPDCVQKLVWVREGLTPEGHCRPDYRVENKACCCPRPKTLPERCDARIGNLVSGQRVFELQAGKCIWRDQLVHTPIVCKPNAQVRKQLLPNGKVRLEKRFHVREGCHCVPKLQVTYHNWKCPAPSSIKRCVQTGSGEFSLEHVSILWLRGAGQTECSRRETVVDQKPVDCSGREMIKALGCQLDDSRHALVRIDRLITRTPDGCRCVPNAPRPMYHVCHCLKPEHKMKCDRDRGLMVHIATRFELSGDRTRCIPHVMKRMWKLTCNPSVPQYKGRTRCDPNTGLFFHLYEESHRDGCRCVKQQRRVPARCRCPRPVRKTRCWGPNTREVMITSYTLTEKGTCVQSVVAHKEPIRCPVPERLLRSTPEYRVELQPTAENPLVVRHVYACNSAGPCKQRIREFAWTKDDQCGCRWGTRQVVRACCCGRPGTGRAVQKRSCDSRTGIRMDQITEWRLEDGHCRPVVHVRSRPVVCEKETVIKPMDICRDGKQKHVILQPVRVGCTCVINRKLITKQCLCPTVSAADVVFLVDASVIKRQPDYLEHVQRAMHDVVHAFTLSIPGTEQGNSYRFAIVIYSHHPELLFNLPENRDPTLLLDQINKITLLNAQGSDLARALKFVQLEIIPQQRPDVPLLIYVITDGAETNWPGVLHAARSVRQGDVQLNLLGVGPDLGAARHFVAQFVTQPPEVHWISMPRAAAMRDHMGRLIQTLCTPACPADYVRQSECGRQTGCIGRAYVHSYRFSKLKGHCVSSMKIQKRRCCCPERPEIRESCEGTRLYQYVRNWQLTKHGACTEFMVKRDLTAALHQRCSPPVKLSTGPCNEEGYAVQLEITKTVEGCKCKESRRTRVVRCHCDPARRRDRCLADNLLVSESIVQHLVHGECMSRSRVTKHRIVCPQPLIHKSGCDSMTCQRRVALVEHIPERCHCQRRVKVKHETCCCRGDRTVNYEGCKYDALKMFVERTIEPTLQVGACVRRTRYHFQPVACPKNPKTIRHQCRQAVTADTGPGTTMADAALVYRQVEHFWWQIGACECRKQQRVHFEACGCDQSRIPPAKRSLTRCHTRNGILVTYVQRLRLEVAGRTATHETGVKLERLQEAKCRPEFKLQSVRKIVCPEAKLSTSPCELAKDGRTYSTVHLHRWFRQGCQCRRLAPELKERRLCACRPRQAMKRCTASRSGAIRNRLEVRVLIEKLMTRTGAGGIPERYCMAMQPIDRVKRIDCPKSRVHYSNCVNGNMKIVVKTFAVHNCQCISNVRRLVAKCRSPAAGQLQPYHQSDPRSPANRKPMFGLVQPVYRLIECLDLLPTPKCRLMERPPHGVCDKPSELQEMLCRRTCNQCSRCPLSKTTFRVVHAAGPGGACILSDRRYGGVFLNQIIPGPVNLARCKLLCARRADCLSFDYYVPSAPGAGSSTASCVLNRVDPATLRRRWHGDIHVGATPVDLQRHQARQCFLFRKLCKPNCPPSRSEQLSPCTCERLEQHASNDLDEEQQNPKPVVTHCVKRVKVLFYAQSSSGHCVRKQWIGMVPCSNPGHTRQLGPEGDCVDKQAPLWCQDRIAQGSSACRDPKLRKVCPKSCGLCKCRGHHVFQGRCHRSGQAVETRITYRPHPLHQLCTTWVQKRKISCEYCPVGRFSVVHACDERSGQRRVAHVMAQLVPIRDGDPARRCAITVHSEQIKCGGCLASESDRQTVLPCRPVPPQPGDMERTAKLKVITEFMINDDGCCRVKRSERSFYCDGCPPLRIETSPCVNGQRLRHFIFFTRPAITHHDPNTKCIPHTVTRKETCKTLPSARSDGCFDQLTSVDCIGLRNIGGCKPGSDYARQLCAYTCGFCPPSS